MSLVYSGAGHRCDRCGTQWQARPTGRWQLLFNEQSTHATPSLEPNGMRAKWIKSPTELNSE
eukprot:9469626-Heterocapsa_arctica.AAC.1